MPGYQPASRRPIAEVFRATARGATRLCLRLGIHADAISYFSLVAAALAALSFWQSSRHPALLIVAPLFCLLRLWCNMLDGMVALAAGPGERAGRGAERFARSRFRCADFCRRGAQRLDASALRLLGGADVVRHGLCRDARAGGRRAAGIQRAGCRSHGGWSRSGSAPG